MKQWRQVHMSHNASRLQRLSLRMSLSLDDIRAHLCSIILDNSLSNCLSVYLSACLSVHLSVRLGSSVCRCPTLHMLRHACLLEFLLERMLACLFVILYNVSLVV